jgi:hypothetical protein
MPGVLDGIAEVATSAAVAVAATASASSAESTEEPRTPDISATRSGDTEAGERTRKRPRAFLDLPFVSVTKDAKRRCQTSEQTKRRWHWCSSDSARSGLRHKLALVRVAELACAGATAEKLRCTAPGATRCEFVGRIVPCQCSTGAAQLLCPLHCAEHCAALVRTGVSGCKCPVSAAGEFPSGSYIRLAHANVLCAAFDKRRSDDDMLRVVERFVEAVADTERVRTPDNLRSPLADDQARVIAGRIRHRLLSTDTRAKQRARRKLFAPPPPPPPLRAPEITVQKAPEWPPQPPPLVI